MGNAAGIRDLFVSKWAASLQNSAEEVRFAYFDRIDVEDRDNQRDPGTEFASKEAE